MLQDREKNSDVETAEEVVELLIQAVSVLQVAALAGVAFGFLIALNIGGKSSDIDRSLGLEILFASCASYQWLLAAASFLHQHVSAGWTQAFEAAVVTVLWWLIHCNWQ